MRSDTLNFEEEPHIYTQNNHVCYSTLLLPNGGRTHNRSFPVLSKVDPSTFLL